MALRLFALLQPDEQDRARRFHRQEDRLRFSYGRLMLKLLVAKYTHQNPEAVFVRAGINKKPELSDIPDLHVNIAHAGEWVLLAVGKKNVGVDIEKISPDFPFEEILFQSFSETERQNIGQDRDPRHRFYQLWTRKEALVKATAKGIDDDFCRVPSLEGEHYTDMAITGSQAEWYIGSFAVSNDYLAAVAHQKITDSPKFYTLESGFFN
ncbi:4'-phosphopantetheinyl transferase superfamily protein [Spirosoma sp. SC4-14]|uniref:4'-phosphopantetheinyl transferase family protein n=1 Tax=Spirosoma sp. SC4-14 TaxID=3128900 RepID=UPI0030CD54D6